MVAAWGKRRGATSPRPTRRQDKGYEAARRGHERQEPAARPDADPGSALRDGPGPRPRPARGTAHADTDGAPGGERAGRRVRRGRNVGTRLEDRDQDIGVFLTGLPSRAERQAVADFVSHRPRRTKSLWFPRRRPSGARKESRHEHYAVPGLRTSAWTWASCAPTAPGRCSPGPCTRAALGTCTGPVAAWREHRAGGRESAGGV